MIRTLMRPSVTLAFLVVGVLSVMGCRSRPDIVLRADEIAYRDSVLSVLAGAHQTAFREAFGKLADLDFTRYIRTEQYDGEDFLIAFNEHVVRISTEGGIRITRVEQSDSAGSFEFGFFKRFVSENVDDLDPVDLVPFVIPEDVGYDKSRNRDRYSFHFLSDTLMWDRQAQVIEVRARPDLADGLNVRRVRHYIDRATNQLVAVYLERIDLALWFREESEFYVDVRPSQFGGMLPYNTRFQTKIMTPYRDTYKFRTVSTFTDFTRSSGS